MRSYSTLSPLAALLLGSLGSGSSPRFKGNVESQSKHLKVRATFKDVGGNDGEGDDRGIRGTVPGEGT